MKGIIMQDTNDMGIVPIERTTKDIVDSSESLYVGSLGDTAEDKVKLFNAINSAIPLRDYVKSGGKAFTCVNIIAHDAEFEDMNNPGVMLKKPRVIFITDKGDSYASPSPSIFSATQRLLSIFGNPSQWGKGINMLPKFATSKRDLDYLTIEIV